MTNLEKCTRKMPILKLHIKKSFKTEMNEPYLIHVNTFQRSNTQPLSQLLKKEAKTNKKTLLTNNKSLDNYPKKNRLLFQSSQKPQHKFKTQTRPELINDFQLLQYRKSIKHLISIFQERSIQLKKLNEHCIHSPIKIKQSHQFNQNISKEIEYTKRHRSKLLQFKRRLRKSILKTQQTQSPRMRRKNVTDLMNAINIKSPYSQLVPINVIRQNSILAFPQIKLSLKQSTNNNNNSPKNKNCKIQRQKRTTIGGWKIDKNETNYLY